MTTANLATLGDFTHSATYYTARARYDDLTLDYIASVIRTAHSSPNVADVGAGTGILTRELASRALSGVAVEPNDAMRTEGVKQSPPGFAFRWLKGSAEATNLPDQSVDWLLMGNAFHWANLAAAAKEFRRILRPAGFFTPVWVLLDTDRDPTVQRIDRLLANAIPGFSRHSGNILNFIHSLREFEGGALSASTRTFLDTSHTDLMSKSRYLTMWQSRNDVQSALPPDEWSKVMSRIDEAVTDDPVTLHLRTYAWIFPVK